MVKKIIEKDTKICNTCNTEFPISNFYYSKTNKRYFPYCITCFKIKKYRYIKKAAPKYVLPEKPGDYSGVEVFKEDVYNLLTLIGWKMSDNGVWFKDGLKDKNNNWNIKKGTNVIDPSTLSLKEKHRLILEYFDDETPIKEIAVIVGVCLSSVYYVLKKYNREY